MKAYIRFIVRNRFIILGSLVLITLWAGSIISKVEISGSVVDLFLGESPKYYRYLERTEEFGSDTLIIIAFEEKDLLGARSIKRLKKAVEKIEAMPEIKSVTSILDLKDIRIKDMFPETFSYVDEALKNPAQSQQLLDQMRSNKLIQGLLISEDGRHTLIAIEPAISEERSDKDMPPLLEKIFDIFTEAGFQRQELHQAGHIPILVEMLKQVQFNIKRLFPIVCVVLFIVVYLLFQRLWPVFITLIVTLIGVTWTMAFAVLLFGKINIMTAMTPGIILIIAFSDVIHLCSSYHMEISKGEWKEQAILKSCSEVGTACLFTSITTFFGFISLALAPSPGSRQLGIVLGVGVGLALLVAMTLTPIIFSLIKAPPPIRVGASSKSQLFLYRAVNYVVKLTRTKPWVIVISFIILLVITITGVIRIEFETDINKRLAEDNPLNVDYRYVSRQFAGTNYLDVFIEAPEPGGIINNDLIPSIRSFEKEITGIREVDKVISIFDVINHIHSKLNPPLDDEEVTFPNEEEIRDYLLMFRTSSPDRLKTMIDPANQTVKIRLNLTDGGFFTSHRVTQSVSASAQAIFGDRVRIEVMGITSLLGEWVESFIEGQKKGLIFAFFMIFLMMTIGLRSFTGGIWSMLPNILPLLFLGGYVGWFWDTADSDLLTVGIIAIGIAVDNTIHFLFRFRHEMKKTENIEIALDKAFHFSGRAIFITSVILVAGFMPFALSGYSSAKLLGTLLPAILAATLFTDMLLIPALIKLGAFQFVKRDKKVRQIKLLKILKGNGKKSKTLQERAARS